MFEIKVKQRKTWWSPKYWVRELARMFGVKTVQTGELLPTMEDNLQESFDTCLNNNSHRREVYWILFTADWYAGQQQLRGTMTPYGVKPLKMLNTICWEIDNKTGTKKELWVLPVDAPTVPGDDVAEPVPEIMDQVEQLQAKPIY